MKISELEDHLRSIREVHGDIEAVIRDADTNWLFRISVSDISVDGNGDGQYVEIAPGYGSEIDSTEINKEVKR